MLPFFSAERVLIAAVLLIGCGGYSPDDVPSEWAEGVEGELSGVEMVS
jgi:hypothetical protein